MYISISHFFPFVVRNNLLRGVACEGIWETHLQRPISTRCQQYEGECKYKRDPSILFIASLSQPTASALLLCLFYTVILYFADETTSLHFTNLSISKYQRKVCRSRNLFAGNQTFSPLLIQNIHNREEKRVLTVILVGLTLRWLKYEQ